MLKRARFFIIIVILALLFLPGFARLQELKQRLSDAEADIRKIQQINSAMEERIFQMRGNKDYLENVARERMGVVKKGETVLRIIHEGEETNVPVTNVSKI